MKRNLVFFAVCFMLTMPVFAQTAAELEQLLSADSVTYEQAAWFMLRVADVPASNPSGAFQHAAERKWLPKNVSADDAARLDGIALLVMGSFGIEGGIGYSLVKNSHYAYREMVYQDIIQGRIDPAMPVSGETLLYIANRVLSQREEGN